MITHVVTRRAYYLISYINSKQFPSKQDLINYLKYDRDFSISNRTLERDFERIASDFGIEIKYSKSRNGYYIDQENSFQIDSFFKFLELVSVSDIFHDSLKNSNQIFQHISFDDSRSFRGIEHIKTMLLAIKQNRELLFDHFSYQKEISRKYRIVPLQLREYENRWYILGVPQGEDSIWSFGIDRITNVHLGKIHDIQSIHRKDLKKYENIIGITFEIENSVEQSIELMVDAEHVKYLESLPLHHSQRIDPEVHDTRQKVFYKLIPNYEFMVQILKMGEKCEVISPPEIRLEIMSMLEKTLEQYR